MFFLGRTGMQPLDRLLSGTHRIYPTDGAQHSYSQSRTPELPAGLFVEGNNPLIGNERNLNQVGVLQEDVRDALARHCLLQQLSKALVFLDLDCLDTPA